MRRLLRRLAALLTTTLVITGALLAMAPPSTAADCGNNVLNVNLGTACNSIVGVSVLGDEPANTGTKTCADGVGCNDVSTPRNDRPVLSTGTPPPPSNPPPVRPAPAKPAPVPVVISAVHYNNLDEAPGESFYSGDFRLRLPYGAAPPEVTPIAPRRGFSPGWTFPVLPREALFSLFGALMVLLSFGGVRKMRETM